MHTVINSLAIAVLISASCVTAFPQNSQNSDEIFPVDGFIFDGPADRPEDLPVGSSTRAPTTGGARITERPTTASTTASTTTMSPVQFDNCVSRCPVTPEYNPVCGTDNVNYDNPGGLNCAAWCGKEVQLGFYGRCTSNPPRNSLAQG